MKPILQLFPFNRQIILLCGEGGVGKTTLSAALAVRAALLGEKTVVMTLDPSQRLAQSLGLKTTGTFDLTESLAHACTHQNLQVPLGSLTAIVPEIRENFKSVIQRLVTQESIQERIFRNPLFQLFSQAFSGAQEYSTLECLRKLIQESHYDKIILDTPPSTHTLSFLETPEVLQRLFNHPIIEKLIRFLKYPQTRWLTSGLKKPWELLEKLIDPQQLGLSHHLLEFAGHLLEIQGRWSDHLKTTQSFLKSEKTGCLIVSAVHGHSSQSILHLRQQLQNSGLRWDGFILNRSLRALNLPQIDLFPTLADSLQLIQALQHQETLFIKTLNTSHIWIVPELIRDVHCMGDLLHVALAFESFAQTSTTSD